MLMTWSVVAVTRMKHMNITLLPDSTQSSFIRKYVTSSQLLRERINRGELDQARDIGMLDITYVNATLLTEPINQPEEHKVLGVHWNIKSDQLIFELSTIVEAAVTVVPTKRRVVSLIGCFYDPLGLLAPITIRFKVLIQELCKSQVNWDEPLKGETLKRWNALITDMKSS